MTLTARIESALEQFGYAGFRDNQELIVQNILRDKNTIAVLRTGAGKSATYQIPAAILDGLTLVISPLIALHQDQVDSLTRRRIAASYVNSRLKSQGEEEAVWKRVQSGETKLLYIAPEILTTTRFWRAMKNVAVSLIVIDEAHCASVWGHDFRREYLEIPSARVRLGEPTTLAVTGTAPARVLDDIRKVLDLNEADVIVGDLDRPELLIEAKRFRSTTGKLNYLVPELEAVARTKKKTLVFCRTIKSVAELGEHLTKAGVAHLIYHAQLDDEIRQQTESAFRTGLAPILVCTKAFGMGVDIPDIRNVFHFDLVESLEEYWQEIGRAGRDGGEARCTLLWQPRDLGQLWYFLRSSNPSLPFIQKVWDWLGHGMKASDWKAPIPLRSFRESRFVDNCAGPDHAFASQITAAIAMLRENHMIHTEGSTLFFGTTPAKIKQTGFPIPEAVVDLKRDSAVDRLRTMYHFACSSSDNDKAHELAMKHLVHNSLAEETRDIDIQSWYVVEEQVVEAVLRALGERDFDTWSLANHLSGRGSVKGSQFGTLEEFSETELIVDLEHIENKRFVRRVPLLNKMYYTLTPEGEAYLRTQGVEPMQPKSYKDLHKRMHSPAGKKILRQVFDDWWRTTETSWSAAEWWEAISDFCTHGFNIFEEEDIAGVRVCANYYHRSTQSGKPDKKRKKTPGPDTKIYTGLTLSNVKDFLNYVFDHAIVTS